MLTAGRGNRGFGLSKLLVSSNINIPSFERKGKLHTEGSEDIDMDRLGPKPVLNGWIKNVDNVCPSIVSGIDYIRNPRLFKGMAFNLQERQGLGNETALCVKHIIVNSFRKIELQSMNN